RVDVRMDRPARGIEIPQPQAKVGVVGTFYAGRAGGRDGGIAGLPGAVADRLADGRKMKEPGTGDVVRRQAVRCHQGGGGILAQVVELVAGIAVGDETDAGWRAGMTADARGIDAFGPPQLEEGVAHPVQAETGKIAGRGTLAGGRDRDILRIAAETLQPGSTVALA